jgi:hypothetical protein
LRKEHAERIERIIAREEQDERDAASQDKW